MSATTHKMLLAAKHLLLASRPPAHSGPDDWREIRSDLISVIDEHIASEVKAMAVLHHLERKGAK